MPLSAHQTPRIVVPLLDDNTVSVRGINLDDFMALLPNNFEAMSKIAATYAAHKESVFSPRAFTEFLLASATGFPNLVAEVISIAADEPDAKGIKLGTSLQLSVLAAIAKLTIEEAGGLGNLFAQLRDLGARLQAVRAEAGGSDAGSTQPNPFSGSTGNGASK